MALQPFLVGQNLLKFRTRHCERYVRLGKCHFADKCQYSHDLEWTRRPLWKYEYTQEICPKIFFYPVSLTKEETIINECPHNRSCNYAHTRLEQMYHPNVYKTVLCNDFMAGGNGKLGCNRYFCPFAHSHEEIVQAEESRKTLIGYKERTLSSDLYLQLRNHQPFLCPRMYMIDDVPNPKLRRKYLIVLLEKDRKQGKEMDGIKSNSIDALHKLDAELMHKEKSTGQSKNTRNPKQIINTEKNTQEYEGKIKQAQESGDIVPDVYKEINFDAISTTFNNISDQPSNPKSLWCGFKEAKFIMEIFGKLVDPHMEELYDEQKCKEEMYILPPELWHSSLFRVFIKLWYRFCWQNILNKNELEVDDSVFHVAEYLSTSTSWLRLIMSFTLSPLTSLQPLWQDRLRKVCVSIIEIARIIVNKCSNAEVIHHIETQTRCGLIIVLQLLKHDRKLTDSHLFVGVRYLMSNLSVSVLANKIDACEDIKHISSDVNKSYDDKKENSNGCYNAFSSDIPTEYSGYASSGVTTECSLSNGLFNEYTNIMTSSKQKLKGINKIYSDEDELAVYDTTTVDSLIDPLGNMNEIMLQSKDAWIPTPRISMSQSNHLTSQGNITNSINNQAEGDSILSMLSFDKNLEQKHKYEGFNFGLFFGNGVDNLIYTDSNMDENNNVDLIDMIRKIQTEIEGEL